MAKKIIKKLTEDDKEELLLLGYLQEDFWQIEQAFKECEFEITDNNIKKGCKTRKCGAARAIEVIGRDEFLSGLGRAAFHCTSARYSVDGRFEICFDLRKWW